MMRGIRYTLFSGIFYPIQGIGHIIFAIKLDFIAACLYSITKSVRRIQSDPDHLESMTHYVAAYTIALILLL